MKNTEKSLALCHAIEAAGASEALTKCSVLASELHAGMQRLEGELEEERGRSINGILAAQSRDRYREALRFIRDNIAKHGGFSQCLAKLEEVGFSAGQPSSPNNGYLGGDVKSLARVLRTEFDELKADKEQAVARERERSEAAGFQRAVDKIREIRSASTSAAWFRDDVTSWLNSLTQPANRSAEVPRE